MGFVDGKKVSSLFAIKFSPVDFHHDRKFKKSGEKNYKKKQALELDSQLSVDLYLLDV